jgi:hypothetical protein
MTGLSSMPTTEALAIHVAAKIMRGIRFAGIIMVSVGAGYFLARWFGG